MFRVSLAIGDKKSGPFVPTSDFIAGTLNEFFKLMCGKGLLRTNVDSRKVVLHFTIDETDLVCVYLVLH